MSNKVSINDLNPRPSSFTFRDKVYELRKFSLAAQVWAHDEFATAEEPNGLNILSGKFRELDLNAVVKTGYYLLKDKTDFPTEYSFLDAFNDHGTALEILLKPISQCLGVSQPQEDDTAEEIELKK